MMLHVMRRTVFFADMSKDVTHGARVLKYDGVSRQEPHDCVTGLIFDVDNRVIWIAIIRWCWSLSRSVISEEGLDIVYRRST